MFRVGPLLALAIGLILAPAAWAEPRVNSFTLGNGMQVVVIEDHRVPVVTHMVWYRVGAADDPWGTSGIAHFLEHLMFKSTEKLKSGEFSRTITRLGGRDNATTTHDTTSYFSGSPRSTCGPSWSSRPTAWSTSGWSRRR
jgi:zinc protease